MADVTILEKDKTARARSLEAARTEDSRAADRPAGVGVSPHRRGRGRRGLRGAGRRRPGCRAGKPWQGPSRVPPRGSRKEAAPLPHPRRPARSPQPTRRAGRPGAAVGPGKAQRGPDGAARPAPLPQSRRGGGRPRQRSLSPPVSQRPETRPGPRGAPRPVGTAAGPERQRLGRGPGSPHPPRHSPAAHGTGPGHAEGGGGATETLPPGHSTRSLRHSNGAALHAGPAATRPTGRAAHRGRAAPPGGRAAGTSQGPRARPPQRPVPSLTPRPARLPRPGRAVSVLGPLLRLQRGRWSGWVCLRPEAQAAAAAAPPQASSVLPAWRRVPAVCRPECAPGPPAPWPARASPVPVGSSCSLGKAPRSPPPPRRERGLLRPRLGSGGLLASQGAPSLGGVRPSRCRSTCREGVKAKAS